jgi:hypothetical protein
MHVKIAVVGATAEAMAAPGQFPAQVVQQDIGPQGR